MAEGQSRFTIRADNSQYDASADRSESKTRKLGKSQRDLGDDARKGAKGVSELNNRLQAGRTALNRYGTLALAAGAALTTALVRGGQQSGDSLAKTADKLGVTTEALASMRFAAEQTGAGSDTLDKGLEKLNVRVAEAAAGMGIARHSFAALGIEAKQLVELSPDEAMRVVADRLSTVENAAQRTKIAYDIFGRSGTALINTLSGGSQQLDVFAQEAEVLGINLSRVDARKIEIANDSMNRTRKQLEGFSQQLAVQFAPVIDAVTERIFGFGKEAGGTAQLAGKAFDFMVKGAGVFANGIRGLEIGWHAMKLAFQFSYKTIIGGLDDLVTAAVEAYNSIPWFDDVEVGGALSGFRLTLESEFEETQATIQRLLMEPLPSEAIEEFVATAQRQFEAQAIAVNDSQLEIRTDLIDTQEVTEALAGKSEAAAKRVTTGWEQTSRDLSGLLRGALDGSLQNFESFKDRVLDIGSNIAANFFDQNLFRPLLQGGSAVGFGVGSQSSAAPALDPLSLVQSGSSLYSTVTGGLSSIALNAQSALVNSYARLGAGFDALGFSGARDAAYNTASGYANGSLASNLGNLGLNVGAGFVGNYAGQLAFGGNTTGIGSGLGGAVGSTFGPFGTAVGAFLGEGIETGLGNVLGFGSGGNNAAQNFVDLANGPSRAQGIGNNFDQENVDTAQQLGDALAELGAIIGGSDFSGKIKVGNKSGIKLDGQRFNDVNDFLIAGYRGVVEQATELSEGLQSALLSLDVEPQRFKDYATAVSSLSLSIKENPITAAVSEFAEQQRLAGRSLNEVYQDQLDGIQTIIAAQDGHEQSLLSLSAAYTENAQLAASLAIAGQQTSEQLSDLIAGARNDIADSLRTDTERLQLAREERNELRRGLGNETDLEELDRRTRRVVELTDQILNALPEDVQRAREDDFDQYLDRLDRAQERATDRQERILRNTADRQQDQVQAVLDGLEQLITQLQTSTDVQLNNSDLTQSLLNDLESVLQGGALPT